MFRKIFVLIAMVVICVVWPTTYLLQSVDSWEPVAARVISVVPVSFDRQRVAWCYEYEGREIEESTTVKTFAFLAPKPGERLEVRLPPGKGERQPTVRSFMRMEGLYYVICLSFTFIVVLIVAIGRRLVR